MTVLELQKEYLPAIAPEDFFLLLSYATGKEKVSLLAHPEYKLPPELITTARQYLDRRKKHEPVAYIVGKKEFYGRSFLVTKDTLIPRPETELLVDRVLTMIQNQKWGMGNREHVDIVDVGTGSGNIIITLAKEVEEKNQVSNIRYHALDISTDALRVATKNAEHYNITKKVTFIESNLLENFPLPKEKNTHLVILANLPYLSEKIYQESDPDVRCFEPKSALTSGLDGLDHYRRLLQEITMRTKHHQSLSVFLEISPEQSVALQQEILLLFPTSTLEVVPDLSGRSRLIQASLL